MYVLYMYYVFRMILASDSRYICTQPPSNGLLMAAHLFPVRCELYIYVHYVLIIVLNGKNTPNKIQDRQYKGLKLDDCKALDLSGN